MADETQPMVLPTAEQAPGLHGGFWRRVAAYIIDYVIIGLLFCLLLVIAAVAAAAAGHPTHLIFDKLDGVNRFLRDLGYFVLNWPYFAFFESSHFQATPGKMILGLVVTDEFGRRISFGRATGRYFAKILSGLILGIGYMMAGWTEHKQALHDVIAGTCVARRRGLKDWQAEAYSGPEPSGKSRGWIIGGVTAAAIIFIGVIVASIAIPVYLNHSAHAQFTEAVNAMHEARDILNEYRRKYGDWPTASRVARFNARIEAHAPIGKYTDDVRIVHCVDQTCGILATMRRSIMDVHLAGKTLELWTTDSGRSWHCGPGGSTPADLRVLPESCRERGGSLL